MEKYIAFGLYAKNEHGAFQPAGEPSLQQDVYLAADVDNLQQVLGDLLRASENVVLNDGDEGADGLLVAQEAARSLMER